MATKLEWDDKYMSERLDYEIDFSQRLEAGETIIESSWSATPEGLTISSAGTFDTKIKAWIEGGEAGIPYTVEGMAVTSGGREMAERVQLKVR